LAGYLFNLLPETMELPAPEQYERIRKVFETAFMALREFEREIPEFSVN
jgi:hypothetical protein